VPRTNRVIKEIESLDQAIKAEQNVESGYHATIDEYLSYWMAVEEDVVESYSKLVETIQNSEVKRTLEQLIEDSKKHRKMLEYISVSLNEIMKDEERHARMLIAAKASLEKAATSAR
jgi:ferritin-like metal-binding protein YciE